MNEKTKRTLILAAAFLIAVAMLTGYLKLPQQAVTTPPSSFEVPPTLPPKEEVPNATAEEAVLCPGTLETKLRIAVYDALTPDMFDQLAVNYKIFDAETGKYMGLSGTTSATGETTVYVPCGKEYKIIFYKDNGSSSDIYPVQIETKAKGASVYVTAAAKKQGCIRAVVWDTTGTESDNTITMGTGETYTQINLKIQENASYSAAQDLVILVDYNTSAFKKITIVGAQKLPGVPTAFSGYEEAWDTGVSLDSYGLKVFPVVVEAMPGVDPTNETITFKIVDKIGYWAVDQATFIWPQPGTTIGMQDDYGNNIGITGACEGTAVLNVN